jgi:late competence protein required for DNA uptake (superfamily II DNA/RNA helicase)
MSFCTVKPEHLTWTVEMTGALMRENLSPEDIVKDIANMLPSNNMFMKATLVSKIPQYIKLIMARNDELSRFYGPKFMSIQDLKESFESEKGYANVLEFINGVTLSDKVDAAIDAIEEEKIKEETNPESVTNPETTKSEKIIKTLTDKSTKKRVSNELKVIKEARTLEPYTPRDEVMLYFINGGKIHESVIDELLKGSKEEKKAKNSLLTKDERYKPKSDSSRPTEIIAHSLYENTELRDSENSPLSSDQDYTDEVEEIISIYNNREQIAKALLRSRKSINEQVPPEGYEDFSEQEQSDEYPDEYVAFQMNERELFEKALAAEQVINVGIGHGIVIENKVETNEKSEQNQEAEKAKTGSDTKAGKRVIQDFGKSIRPTFRDAVPDRLKTELTDHQQTGVNAIVQAVQEKKHFLLADGAGAGKTRILLTAAQALKNSGKRVIIITENKEIIAGSFKNDSKTLGMPFRQDKIGNAESDGTRVVTMNAFKDSSKVDPSQYDVLIVDESQKASGLVSQISSKVKSFKGQIIYSSATPFDTEEKTIYILPKLFNISEQDYISEIDAKIQKVPGRTTPELVFPRGKGKFNALMNTTHQRLIVEGKMLHRRYEFFGDDNLNIDTIGNADEFGGGYSIEQVEEGISTLAREKVKKAFLTENDIKQGKSIEDKKRDINTQKANALKRVPESFKANTQLLNQVEQDLKEGKQVILYSINVDKEGLSFEIMTPDNEIKKINRPVFIEQMKKKLSSRGLEFGVITGAEKNRAASVEKFQNGELKILLINEAGTTGINLNDTLGNAPRKLYIAGALPNAIQLEQVKGRVSRINNASPAEVVYVSVNSDSEIKNREKLLGKVAIMNSILKGEQLEAGAQAQEVRANIKQEVAENPKAPYIEKQPGGTHFLVKNTKSIYKALGREGLQGEYKGFLKAWKFKIERLDEVQSYLNSISTTTIAPELQIKKIDGAIAAEEALGKEEQPKASKIQGPIDSAVVKSLKDLLRPSEDNLGQAEDQKNKPC